MISDNQAAWAFFVISIIAVVALYVVGNHIDDQYAEAMIEAHKSYEAAIDYPERLASDMAICDEANMKLIEELNFRAMIQTSGE